jgi:hypothetical protein
LLHDTLRGVNGYFLRLGATASGENEFGGGCDQA